MAKKKENSQTPEERLREAIIPEDQQPYKLPENWVWVKLIGGAADCLDVFRKPVNATERLTRTGEIPYYGATGQVGWIDHYLTDEQLVLVGEDGAPFLDYTKDKAYIINGRAWVNNHAHILRSKFGESGNKYLMHYLNIFDYKGFVNGTTRLKLTQSSMQIIPVPIPPLPEQQRIVDRIENLFAKLDSAKELIQSALDSFETRRSAILHKAFTGELTASWRKSHGVSMDSWEEYQIKDVAKVSSGGTPSRNTPDYYAGEIPWIKTGEINWNYICNSEEKITQVAIEHSSAKLFPKGTVLIAMYGQGLTRGKTGILGIEATTNQAVCALIPNKKAANRFLFYYFMNHYWDFREKAVGGMQPNYSGTMIGQFIIPVPKVIEQNEIVRILDKIFEQERSAKNLVDIIDKIDLIKKSILARAFRGELGTNNKKMIGDKLWQ